MTASKTAKAAEINAAKAHAKKVHSLLVIEREINEARHTEGDVRVLLDADARLVIPTATMAAYLSCLIVREQNGSHFIDQTVKWTLAMFDARRMSDIDTLPGGHLESLATAVENYIEERITPGEQITLQLALNAIRCTLGAVFGTHMRIKGWMPGFRIADSTRATNNSILELTGQVCPSCLVNPAGHRVNKGHAFGAETFCLNSQDCGWRSVQP